ncbi:hypothetical protein, partial [Pseudomonas syringae]|uniref:hypothetical protein n=1 Tax=Pseudomonas syringae TaxID=317 RepID=UPI001FEDCFC4
SKKASFGTPFLLDAFSGESASSSRLTRNRAPANGDVKTGAPRTERMLVYGAFFLAKNAVLRLHRHI